MELIDRSLLKAMICNLHCALGETNRLYLALNEVLRCVDTIPTIDPVKHGKVIEEAGFDFCSECDHRIEDLVMNYCPNCGACLDADDPEGSTAK